MDCRYCIRCRGSALSLVGIKLPGLVKLSYNVAKVTGDKHHIDPKTDRLDRRLRFLLRRFQNSSRASNRGKRSGCYKATSDGPVFATSNSLWRRCPIKFFECHRIARQQMSLNFEADLLLDKAD